MSFFTSLRTFHRYYEVVIGIIAYSLNILVIYLVLAKSNKFANNYRRILLLSCLCDVWFTTITLITMEFPEITDDKIFMITDGIIPAKWACHASAVWIFSLYMTVVNVPMLFLTRYSVVCRSRPYTAFQYLCIYVVGTMYVVIHAALMYLTFDYEGHSTKFEEYAKLLRRNKMFTDDMNIGFTVGDASNIWTAIHFTNALVMMTSAYTIVIYTGLKIWRTLAREKHSMSSSTLAAHESLTRILLLQALYPFLTVAGPLILANFLPALKIQTMYLGFCLDIIATLIPTLNSLSVLLIVPTYRKLVFNMGRTSVTQFNSSQAFSYSQSVSHAPETSVQRF